MLVDRIKGGDCAAKEGQEPPLVLPGGKQYPAPCNHYFQNALPNAFRQAMAVGFEGGNHAPHRSEAQTHRIRDFEESLELEGNFHD